MNSNLPDQSLPSDKADNNPDSTSTSKIFTNSKLSSSLSTESNSKFSPEEQQLKQIHRQVKKNRGYLRKKSLDFHFYAEVSKDYRQAIDKKITKFKDELIQYFKKHSSPIFAYDIEEQKNKILCFCGIELFPDLSYRLYFKMPKNIFRYYKSNTFLHKLIQELLAGLDSKIVIAHGNNQKEQKFANEAQKELKNTEIMARKAMNAPNKEYRLGGSGLQHFEEKIGFERSACKFFKHDWVWFSYFNAMEWSFRNFLLAEPQRTCIDCGNPQDVLFYCLEDAIVSLFIYCWYSNHQEEIEPDTNLTQEKE